MGITVEARLEAKPPVKMEKYTNQDLARDYFDVATVKNTYRDAVYLRRCIWVKSFIEGSSSDMVDYYRKHGSFEDFGESKLIGKQTKEILALILERGVEAAKQVMMDRQNLFIHDTSFRVPPPLSTGLLKRG